MTHLQGARSHLPLTALAALTLLSLAPLAPASAQDAVRITFSVNETLDNTAISKISNTEDLFSDKVLKWLPSQSPLQTLSVTSSTSSTNNTPALYHIDTREACNPFGTLYFNASDKGTSGIIIRISQSAVPSRIQKIYLEIMPVNDGGEVRYYHDYTSTLNDYTARQLAPASEGYRWYEFDVTGNGIEHAIGAPKALDEGSQDNRFYLRSIVAVPEGCKWTPGGGATDAEAPAPGEQTTTFYFDNAAHWGGGEERPATPDGIMGNLRKGEYTYVHLSSSDGRENALAPGRRIDYDKFFDSDGYYTGPMEIDGVVYALTDVYRVGTTEEEPVTLLSVSFRPGLWDNVAFYAGLYDYRKDSYGNPLYQVAAGTQTSELPVADGYAYCNLPLEEAAGKGRSTNCDFNMLEPAEYVSGGLLYDNPQKDELVPFICYYGNTKNYFYENAYVFIGREDELLCVQPMTKTKNAQEFIQTAGWRNYDNPIMLNANLDNLTIWFNGDGYGDKNSGNPISGTTVPPTNNKIWRKFETGEMRIGSLNMSAFNDKTGDYSTYTNTTQSNIFIKGNVYVNDIKANTTGQQLSVNAETGLYIARLKLSGDGTFVLSNTSSGSTPWGPASSVTSQNIPLSAAIGGRFEIDKNSNKFQIDDTEEVTVAVDIYNKYLYVVEEGNSISVSPVSAEGETLQTACRGFGGLRIESSTSNPLSPREEIRISPKGALADNGDIPYSEPVCLSSRDTETGPTVSRVFLNTPGEYEILMSVPESELCGTAAPVTLTAIAYPTPVSAGMSFNHSPVYYRSAVGNSLFANPDADALMHCDASGRRTWYYWSDAFDANVMDRSKEGDISLPAGDESNADATWATDGTRYWLNVGPENARLSFSSDIAAHPELIDVWYRIETSEQPQAMSPRRASRTGVQAPEGFTRYIPAKGIDLTDALDKARSIQVIIDQNGIRSPEHTIQFHYTSSEIPTGLPAAYGDCDTDGPALYFTPAGIPVDPDNLQPGIYIVRQGSRSMKIKI